MNSPKLSRISPRKEPKQARSAQMMQDILEAAIRVLDSEGADRFTTVRVAERAGVSVGSLYQYFPSKEAILFRLQADEWHQTGELLKDILQGSSVSPQQRLRQLVHAFFVSEYNELPLRVALGSSEICCPNLNQDPEARKTWEAAMSTINDFMCEALPLASDEQRHTLGEVIFTTMIAMGTRLASEKRTPQQVEHFADSVSDMFCAYLHTVRMT